MEQLLITFALVAFFMAALSLKLIKDGKSAKIGCSGGGSKENGGSCSTCSTVAEDPSSCGNGTCSNEEEPKGISCGL